MTSNPARSAKAVIGIDEIHLYKHGSAGEPVIDSTLIANTTDWFSIATLKGSVEISQDALNLTKVNIDQSNLPIGISTEPGDFNINFQMPDLTGKNLKQWLEQGTTKLTIGDKEGYGYGFNSSLIDLTVAIKAKTGEWFIFPYVQGSTGLQQAEDTTVLAFTGMVLAATNPANKDVYILSDDVVSAA